MQAQKMQFFQLIIVVPARVVEFTHYVCNISPVKCSIEHINEGFAISLMCDSGIKISYDAAFCVILITLVN